MKSSLQNNPIYILGIYYGHNATASLIKDGEVIAVVSEERFNNVKNYTGFPKQAIKCVLEEARIIPRDLELVTISHKYGTPIHSLSQKNKGIKFSIILSKTIHSFRKKWGSLAFKFNFLRKIGRAFYLCAMLSIGYYTNGKERDFISNYLKIDKNKVKAYDHHLSHAASSYYASDLNQKKCLALTLDGEGDGFCASVNIFEKNKYKTISKTPRESSLGLMYAYLTSYLGMRPNEHEYKVMGLAPYAKEEEVEKLYKKVEKIIKINPENLIFEAQFNLIDIDKFIDKNLKNIRFDLLSAVFQKLVEEKVTEWVKVSIKKTGVKNIVLSGGVFMNVKLNKKIMEIKDVESLFIIPSSGDESSILGSSYLAYIEYLNINKLSKNIMPISDIYWGPVDKEVKKVMKKINKKYEVKEFKNIEREIAKLLSKGNPVARLAGRMEFGARALGNRSILADPRSIEVVRIINNQIKNRDFWMPFAPSILEEKTNKYIINPKNLKSFYMMLSFDSTDLAKEDLKAAMHQSDFTLRPQIVSSSMNPKYYSIIKEFEKITGVGAVLNTSFNLHGYPVVRGAEEALYVFENSGLKYLAIENYLITKND